MNELIKVTTNENDEQLVSGRELHEFLEVKDNYTDWFKRMIKYGFEESIDFISFSEKSDKPFGGRPQINHFLKLDMAKEISMIQRSEKGKQARKYFLQVEKAWNNPEMVVQRALQIQTRKVEALQLENEQLKPKALFADSVSASHTSIFKRKGTDWNMPTQKSMELGLFEVKETVVSHSDGHTSINKTPKVTGKGQVYFVNKLLLKT